MHVLMVEDDVLLGAGLSQALTQAGFLVDWVTDGQTALQRLQNHQLRALVLDITLPGLDGLSVLQQLRASGSKLPVLMLTARDTTRDKVQCFDSGADDFLVKTTDIEELIARLHALIRRAGYQGRLDVGHLSLDPDAHTLTQAGTPVYLSRREFELLRVLMEGVGHVMTRARLEQSMLGGNREGESNVLEVHIHHLRQKIGEDLIKTVRGVGYTLLAPTP